MKLLEEALLGKGQELMTEQNSPHDLEEKKRKEKEAGVPQSHLRTHTNDPQILYEPSAPAKGSSVSQEHTRGFVFNTGTKQNHIP